MNIVITMAGLGSRFQKAGYKEPKYMIEVNGKNLFEWSMLSLEDFKNQTNVKYIFVTRKENNSRDFINKETEKMGIKNVNIVKVEGLTDGQATSAMLAKKYWNEDEEMIIYNIDTFVEPYEIKYLRNASRWIYSVL